MQVAFAEIKGFFWNYSYIYNLIPSILWYRPVLEIFMYFLTIVLIHLIQYVSTSCLLNSFGSSSFIFGLPTYSCCHLSYFGQRDDLQDLRFGSWSFTLVVSLFHLYLFKSVSVMFFHSYMFLQVSKLEIHRSIQEVRTGWRNC